jgi:NAD-dependent deacetylase
MWEGSVSEEIQARLDAVAERLARSRRVLFITGAGISADSGLPTYRGVGGLYGAALTPDGVSIEEALSGDMFAARPDITWRYLAQIESGCRGAMPNDAHHAIVRLERHLDRVMTFTQNVDGLHRAAGSRDLIEIHGNLHDLMCTACAYRERVVDLAGRDIPPLCPACGSMLRPDVVLFGEALPEGGMARLIDALQTGFDMVFSIGTSSLFPYILQPVIYARQSGTPTVEINPATTPMSALVDYHLPLGAVAAMRAIMSRVGLD